MNTHNEDIVVDDALESRKLLTRDGIQWIRAAFGQFKAFPFIWIALAFGYLLLMLLSMQSVLLSFLSFLFMPIFNGSILMAAATGDNGIMPRIEQLFSAFKTFPLKLVIVGSLWGLISTFFNAIFFAIVPLGLIDPNATVETLLVHFHSLPVSTLMLLGGVLWIFIYLSVAYTLIPGLIIFNRLTPFSAYYFAFSACLRNWRPLMLYMLVMSSLGMLASILLFLGWIVLLPMLMIANFYIWKDLFALSLPHYSYANEASPSR